MYRRTIKTIKLFLRTVDACERDSAEVFDFYRSNLTKSALPIPSNSLFSFSISSIKNARAVFFIKIRNPTNRFSVFFLDILSREHMLYNVQTSRTQIQPDEQNTRVGFFRKTRFGGNGRKSHDRSRDSAAAIAVGRRTRTHDGGREDTPRAFGEQVHFASTSEGNT